MRCKNSFGHFREWLPGGHHPEEHLSAQSRVPSGAGRDADFFDELQACPNCATSLKSFRQDGRFDVICSGSLMGISYREIESNSVGYKEDYEMHSMDFEEFLWAKGYQEGQIADLYRHMLELEPFSRLELETMLENFREYMVLGGCLQSSIPL